MRVHHVIHVAALIFIAEALAAQQLPNLTAIVHVDCSDTVLRDQVQSFAERELRSFADVNVARTPPSEKPVATLYITALTSRTRSGIETGYILGVAFTTRYYCAGDTNYVERYVNSGAFAGGRGDDELRSTVNSIITSFDSEVVGPYRDWVASKKK